MPGFIADADAIACNTADADSTSEAGTIAGIIADAGTSADAIAQAVRVADTIEDTMADADKILDAIKGLDISVSVHGYECLLWWVYEYLYVEKREKPSEAKNSVRGPVSASVLVPVSASTIVSVPRCVMVLPPVILPSKDSDSVFNCTCIESVPVPVPAARCAVVPVVVLASAHVWLVVSLLAIVAETLHILCLYLQ